MLLENGESIKLDAWKPRDLSPSRALKLESDARTVPTNSSICINHPAITELHICLPQKPPLRVSCPSFNPSDLTYGLRQQ